MQLLIFFSRFVRSLIKLSSGLNANVVLKKLQVFPNRLTTWLRDCLKKYCLVIFIFLREGVLQRIPYMQRGTFEIIQNFYVRWYRNFIDLGVLRSGSVHDFKAISLSFLFTLAKNSNRIYLGYSLLLKKYRNESAPKRSSSI